MYKCTDTSIHHQNLSTRFYSTILIMQTPAPLQTVQRKQFKKQQQTLKSKNNLKKQLFLQIKEIQMKHLHSMGDNYTVFNHSILLKIKTPAESENCILFAPDHNQSH